MHALLFGGMTLAVQWRTQPAAPIVAELWSSLPPQQVVVPVPEVAPPPPPPPPKPAPEPERDADIALKVEKKPPPKIEPKVEEKKPEPTKEEKKPEPKKEPKEAKKVEPRKEEPRPQTDLERILAQAQAGAAPAAGGAAAPGTTASGVRGSDGGYSALVIACIRPHIVFAVPDGTGANVYADFRVELLPDGAVAAVRLLRASGLAGYDAAAERAIRRCDPFPRKRDGSIDRTIDVRMYPVEPR
jgi:colicin import membrane protein